MKSQNILVHLLSLCLGILIFTYFTEGLSKDVWENIYYCVFGSLFTWFKMKRDSKNESNV